MKKLITISMTMLFVAFANIISAQTLEDILKKHFEAVGQEKLMAAKSIYIKANVTQMGMEIPMEMKVKRPNKFLIDLEAQGQKITQAFDGEKGWLIVPGITSEPQELSGDALEQAKQQPDMLVEGALYNYENKGSKAEFVGKVNLNGVEEFRIKLTQSDDTESDYFINAETYMIDKVGATVSSGDQSVDVEQILSDYKITDGIAMPSKIVQNSPFGNTTISIQEIRFNENFDDSMFKFPTQ